MSRDRQALELLLLGGYAQLYQNRKPALAVHPCGYPWTHSRERGFRRGSSEVQCSPHRFD